MRQIISSSTHWHGYDNETRRKHFKDAEDNASNATVLELEVGDDQYHRTTFSGFLFFLRYHSGVQNFSFICLWGFLNKEMFMGTKAKKQKMSKHEKNEKVWLLQSFQWFLNIIKENISYLSENETGMEGAVYTSAVYNIFYLF